MSKKQTQHHLDSHISLTLVFTPHFKFFQWPLQQQQKLSHLPQDQCCFDWTKTVSHVISNVIDIASTHALFLSSSLLSFRILLPLLRQRDDVTGSLNLHVLISCFYLMKILNNFLTGEIIIGFGICTANFFICWK